MLPHLLVLWFFLVMCQNYILSNPCGLISMSYDTFGSCLFYCSFFLFFFYSNFQYATIGIGAWKIASLFNRMNEITENKYSRKYN